MTFGGAIHVDDLHRAFELFIEGFFSYVGGSQLEYGRLRCRNKNLIPHNLQRRGLTTGRWAYKQHVEIWVLRLALHVHISPALESTAYGTNSCPKAKDSWALDTFSKLKVCRDPVLENTAQLATPQIAMSRMLTSLRRTSAAFGEPRGAISSLHQV